MAELDDKERTILLGLYTNVLSELKEITEFWTQKVPALPAKVAPLPDVSKEDSNGKLYQIYKEHRDYLEELLGNYLEALQKSNACGDILTRVWDIKKKYKISTKNDLDTDEAEEKKHKYWRQINVLDVIDKRLSEKQEDKISNTTSEEQKDLTIADGNTITDPPPGDKNIMEGKSLDPVPGNQTVSQGGESQAESLEQHQSELKRLTTLYEESQHRNAELKDKLIHLQEKEQEYKNIAERFNQSEQTNIELTEKMIDLQEKEQELIETIERQDKILKLPEKKTKATIAQLQAELKKKQTELEKVTKNFKKVHKELTEERVEVEKLKKEFTKLREPEKRPKTAPISRNIQEMQRTLEDLRKQNTFYIENNQTLKSEKDSLMQRLSKIAGSKMKDNNPSIADLSDPNRPERLAEKYKEIYDNAWTDALDKLDEVTGEGDSKCVQAILNVLKEIYNECKNEIDSRRRTMMELVGYDVKVLQKQMSPGGNSEYDPNIKMCKDLIKSSARKINEAVLKVVKGKTEVAEVIKLCGDSAIKFVTNCTDLCIHMSVQDPPVVFYLSYQSGDHFDKDCLNAFTRGGDVIDYLVWPPMYLHTDGPLLSKGIAQGKSTKSKAIDSTKSDQQQTSDDRKEATAQKAVEEATKSKRDKRNRHNDQEPPENAKDKRNERRCDKPVDIPKTNNEQPSDQDVEGNLNEKSLEKGNSNRKNKHSKLNDMAKEMTEQDSNERHGEHKQETETKQQKEQHNPEAIQHTNQKEKSAKKKEKGPKESNIEEPIADEKSGKGKDNTESVDDDDDVITSGATTKTNDKDQSKKGKII